MESEPIRLSEIISSMGCPEKARREKIDGRGPGNVYTVGGTTAALAAEYYFQQYVGQPFNPDALAKLALEAAITEEEKSCGEVWLSPEQGGMIIDRVGTILHHLAEWWPTCGYEMVACEIEMRSLHTVERGGRFDFMVRRLSDGALGVIDGKAFGVFGKSVSAQSRIPNLNQENQCGWYGSMLAHGTYAFIGVPNRHRHTLTSELKKLYRHKIVQIMPKFYGQLQYGHLIPFTRNGKTAKKGDFRGDVLYITPFHDHLIRNADALAAWYHVVSTLAPTPSVKRYADGGKYNCDTCRFAKSCWPDASTPEPMAEIPSFVTNLIGTQP